MIIEKCGPPILADKRENQIFIKDAFPIACYHDDLMHSQVNWHWHDELEFLIVTEGAIIAAREEEEFYLPGGSGFFVNAGHLHAMWNAGTGHCRLHSMVFRTKLLGSAEEVYFTKYLGPLIGSPGLASLVLSPEIPWQRRMLSRIEEAWELCRDEPEGYEWGVRSALSEAMFVLWQNRPKEQEEDRMARVRRERLKQMIAYLEGHFDEPLTLKEIAGAASISQSEALRCFDNIVHTTPIAFLIDYRLGQAAERLKNSSESVTAVAAECGFSDPGYFIRAFRKKYGCTPGKWRAR